MTHLHTSCPAVHVAKSVICNNTPDPSKFLLLRHADSGLFRLEGKNQSKGDLIACLTLSLAVWEVRQQLNEVNRPSVVNTGHDIATKFRALYREATARKKKSQRNLKADSECFLKVWNTLPFPSVRAFTDGSSFGNPGPAGCGVTYQRPGQRRKHMPVFLHHQGTNYFAEIHGIRVACQAIHKDLTRHPTPSDLPVFIFVDCQPAIKAVDGKSRVRSHKRLVLAAQTALAKLREVAQVTLLWVPGHAGIAANDTADGLAKRGAQGNTSNSLLRNAPRPAKRPVSYVPLFRAADKEAKTPTVPETCASPEKTEPPTNQQRRSKRVRDRHEPLVDGIDFNFSPALTSRKKRKRTASPVPSKCPHGVYYDYSHLNTACDLPSAGLTCQLCRESDWAINTHGPTDFPIAIDIGIDDVYDSDYDPSFAETIDSLQNTCLP